jgi:hypothetical protein
MPLCCGFTPYAFCNDMIDIVPANEKEGVPKWKQNAAILQEKPCLYLQQPAVRSASGIYGGFPISQRNTVAEFFADVHFPGRHVWFHNYCVIGGWVVK